MKKYGLVLIIALLLVACNSTHKSEPRAEISDSLKNVLFGMPPETPPTTTAQDSEKNITEPLIITEDEFASRIFNFRKEKKWKYIGNKPCIVDFYADWCGPCRAVAPVMKELAREYGGKIFVYKVNTDYAPNLTRHFGIKGIPAVMFCPVNGDYQFLVGAQPKEQYVAMIKNVLKI